MQYVIRKWSCRTCGRANATEVALDGSVKCDGCAGVMTIQPSRARGGETSDQLSAFIQVDGGMRRRLRPGAENTGDETPGTSGSTPGPHSPLSARPIRTSID